MEKFGPAIGEGCCKVGEAEGLARKGEQGRGGRREGWGVRFGSERL